MRLKILSLWQPHATLCITPSIHNKFIPAKPVETRHWKTEFRGWLGIHSAMKKDPLYKYLAGEPDFTPYIKDFEKLPFGYILGMVYVDNCHPTDGLGLSSFIELISNEDPARMKEIYAFGDFTPGRFGFAITDFVQFTTPLRVSGAQGFWYHEMPNFIGETVRVKHTGNKGIVLDYNPETPKSRLVYLVKDMTDGEKQWYPVSGIEHINTTPAAPQKMF